MPQSTIAERERSIANHLAVKVMGWTVGQSSVPGFTGDQYYAADGAWIQHWNPSSVPEHTETLIETYPGTVLIEAKSQVTGRRYVRAYHVHCGRRRSVQVLCEHTFSAAVSEAIARATGWSG